MEYSESAGFTSPNFSKQTTLSIAELDEFIATRDQYKNTTDPIRTLQFAFVDEAMEVTSACPKSDGAEYDHENLIEELGDSFVMAAIVAHSQNVSLRDILHEATISDSQQVVSDEEEYTPLKFDTAYISLYDRINPDYLLSENSPTLHESLHAYFQQLMSLATTHNIDMEQSLRQTMTKLEQRQRPNHAVKADGEKRKPSSHVGRYLVKMGVSLDEVLAAESAS